MENPAPLPPPPPELLTETALSAEPLIPHAWDYVGAAYGVVLVAMLWLIMQGYMKNLTLKRELARRRGA